MKTKGMFLAMVLLVCSLAASGQSASSIRLNEVLVINVDNFVDDYGSRSGWIELFNNSPGTIDADYRGELKIVLVNLSDTPFTVCDGERIGQMVVARCEHVEWQPVEALDETERGSGGFGHTGI